MSRTRFCDPLRPYGSAAQKARSPGPWAVHVRRAGWRDEGEQTRGHRGDKASFPLAGILWCLHYLRIELLCCVYQCCGVSRIVGLCLELLCCVTICHVVSRIVLSSLRMSSCVQFVYAMSRILVLRVKSLVVLLFELL